ncbi:uncharacterized protein LOC143301175 [Babylonia areolata]|uniref:uncharacterized protein LOC143301175 n=1 Tax=Babylonia areolata TaxID=304850 RepID=UPI003FD2B42D
MKVMCLLLVLGVAVVYQVEAGWWTRATEWIGNAASAVVDTIGKKHRRRRQLAEDMDPNALKKVDKICHDFHIEELTPDGITLEMIKVAFEKTDMEDGKTDDALNISELDDFITSVEVFQHCMKKNGEAPATTA